MKLLFNHNTNDGSAELKELIGHIDADFTYAKIKSDIETASIDIIKIIGQPVYDVATAAYEANSTDEANKELIYKIRYAIALDAYRHHAKASDVVHSNNGRKIRVDEKNKLPFEWMLDRDDEILERKYYKAVDLLIEYLDTYNAVWKASDAFKDSQKYFVRSTSDFDEVFQINSRLLLIKLQPGIKQCERKHIIPLITQEVNDAIKLKLQNGTDLTDAEKSLVVLIKEACVFHALAWAMKVLRVTLFPEGILQRYTSDRMSTKATKPSEKLETELAAQEFTKQSKEALKEIEILLTAVAITNPDPEVIKQVSTPIYGFDDCDGFASL